MFFKKEQDSFGTNSCPDRTIQNSKIKEVKFFIETASSRYNHCFDII